ncbi:Dimeric alpha-beta barrel [Penicillium nucicola]|uniref:Dimeric alpha-beta barrel n=1 Tax=Penicillium nucicola TaxID=1850975 RepID=UPI002544D502|nr:Dimeric alpha-beta barrel [Penicillium nucicola]KAJ5747910.1 Dimeric alpha-beta barrel [Penicillium nucicola]
MSPLPKDYQFTHPELSYEAKPNFQTAIKVSVFFRKLEGISYDDFFAHWQTVHADLTVATQAFQDHILRYVQHHQTPEMKARLASIGGNMLDFDACAHLWVKDWDSWLVFYNSPEYAAALLEDCDRFIQMPISYMVGSENLIVGKAFEPLGNTDGLSTNASG